MIQKMCSVCMVSFYVKLHMKKSIFGFHYWNFSVLKKHKEIFAQEAFQTMKCLVVQRGFIKMKTAAQYLDSSV